MSSICSWTRAGRHAYWKDKCRTHRWNLCHRNTQVQSWAKEVAIMNGVDNFKASDGWLHMLLDQNGYCFWQITNLTSLTLEKLIKRAISYMVYLLNAKNPSLAFNQTILMDETAVYLEDPCQATINVSGKRHVMLKSTGFASMQVTMILAVSGTGRKLPPMIMYKKAGTCTPTVGSTCKMVTTFVIIRRHG